MLTALEHAPILKIVLAFLEGLHQEGEITLLSYCIIVEMDPHPAVLGCLDNSQAVNDGILVVSPDQVGRTLARTNRTVWFSQSTASCVSLQISDILIPGLLSEQEHIPFCHQ